MQSREGVTLQSWIMLFKVLAYGGILPTKHKDHALTGNRLGYRECHITPDWLLVYQIDNELIILTLTRTGSHADIF